MFDVVYIPVFLFRETHFVEPPLKSDLFLIHKIWFSDLNSLVFRPDSFRCLLQENRRKLESLEDLIYSLTLKI